MQYYIMQSKYENKTISCQIIYFILYFSIHHTLYSEILNKDVKIKRDIPPTFFSKAYEIPFKFTDGTVSSYTEMTKHCQFERLKETKNDLKYKFFSTAL